MSLISQSVKKAEKEETLCKGLFFRGTVNIFATETYVRETRQVKLLKKMSCKGCEKCGWIMELVHEDVMGGDYETFLADVKDGKLYTPHISSSQDFESGYWEIDEIYFKEVK